MQAVKILPPTAEEIENARQALYEKLERSEKQPVETMRSAREVLTEARSRLKINAKI